MPNTRIIEDDLLSDKVARLLGEHLESMYLHSPPGGVHALDLSGLRAKDVTLWTLWRGEELQGCGALRELDSMHGEIKSMRTAKAHLRQGVGSAILRHLIEKARMRGYTRISLETGSGPAFAAADALYRAFGFDYCGPFGSYKVDPFSRFMTRTLTNNVGDTSQA